MAKKKADEEITQKEAVKRALAAGKDLPSDGVAFIRETFGKDLTNGAFSTLKTLIKKEGATAEPTVEAPVAAAVAPDETIGKSEAVRRALAAGKTLPSDGIAYVKEHFGLEMTSQQFSTAKFQENKKKSGGKPGRKPGRPAMNGTAAPVAARVTTNPADLVRSLRQLIAAFGPEAVKDVASALAE